MIDSLLYWTLVASLVVHLALVAFCIRRVWRGENVIDRLIGADVIGTLGLAILLLIGMQKNDTLFLDAAVGLAALSYIASIAIAKYIADRRAAPTPTDPTAGPSRRRSSGRRKRA
jgi:multicomponent Na+:H+ antiporter subunit F